MFIFRHARCELAIRHQRWIVRRTGWCMSPETTGDFWTEDKHFVFMSIWLDFKAFKWHKDSEADERLHHAEPNLCIQGS
jgi:hypothetical protein